MLTDFCKKMYKNLAICFKRAKKIEIAEAKKPGKNAKSST